MHILKNRDFLRYYFKLTLPVMIQQLLVNLVSMCDTLMISSVGEDAISAVAVANKFSLFIRWRSLVLPTVSVYIFLNTMGQMTKRVITGYFAMAMCFASSSALW